MVVNILKITTGNKKKKKVGRPRKYPVKNPDDQDFTHPRDKRGSMSRANMDILRDREDDQIRYRMKKMQKFSRAMSEYAFICIDGCCEEDGYPLFFSGSELDRAKAHQNFKRHQVVVIHEEDGKLGPLNYF